MASEYKINLKRFNGTDYDTIFPSTTSDVVKYNDGTTLEQNRTKSIIFTVPVSAWTGTATPYTCTVNVNGITPKTNGIIGVASNATEAQYTESLECGFRLTAQGEGTVTIISRYKKPTVDVPLEIIVTGIEA